MSYESPLKHFRDMCKDPDPHDPISKAEVMSELRVEESSKPEYEKNGNNHELLTVAGEAFKKTVDNVRQAAILPEFESNETEKRVIEQRRDLIINSLSKVLEDIKGYLNQVNNMQMQRVADYDNPDRYQEAVGSSDALRRACHNKLIQSIKLAMRLININLNADYPEDMRIKEESKMPDRKGMDAKQLTETMRQRKYFKFPYPAGVFIDFTKAPRDPLGERQFIASWALDVYSDLASLFDSMNKWI